MIETATTADPKIICSAVHLSKEFTQKTGTYYYKRKSKKEMSVQIPQNIFLQKYKCK